MNSEPAQSLSIVSGPSLSDEPGLGTLTLPGFLRDVTSMYGDREALAFRSADGITRWTYADLWERAIEVACALRASGVGKDTRVGVLMTNRPEWLSAFFGISLAGGVAVTLSTFSTPAELEYLTQRRQALQCCCSNEQVLKTDFARVLSDLAPEIGRRPRRVAIRQIPVISAISPRSAMRVARHRHVGRLPRKRERSTARIGLCDGGRGAPKRHRRAVLFLRARRAGQKVYSARIAEWPSKCGGFAECAVFAPDDNIRCWSANGYFWSGNFVMSLGATLAAGGCLVLQPTFAAVEAL